MWLQDNCLVAVCVFKVFTYTWQKLHYPQYWKELLAEVPVCDKPCAYSYAQSRIGMYIDHAFLERFFFFLMIILSLCHLWSFKVGLWGYKISLPSKMCVFYIIMDWSMLSGGVVATPKISLCGNKGFSIYLFIVQLHLSTMCQWQFAQVFIQWSRNGKRKQTTKKEPSQTHPDQTQEFWKVILKISPGTLCGGLPTAVYCTFD